MLLHAWGIEHPFPRLQKDDLTGLPDVPATPWVPGWDTGEDCQTIPSLRALTLTPGRVAVNHWPDGCPNEAEFDTIFDPSGSGLPTYEWTAGAGTWIPDAPMGHGTRTWLKCAALPASPWVASITSYDDWAADPCFEWLVWRWAVPNAVTARPYVALRVGGADGIVIRLPVASPGVDIPDRPQVYRLDTGVAAYVLAEWDSGGSRQRVSDSGPQMEVVTFRTVEPGVYVVTLSGTDGEAMILDDTLSLAEEPLVCTMCGALGSFSVTPMEFPASGTAKKAAPGYWPAWSNPSDGYLDIRTYLPLGGSVSSDIDLHNVGGGENPLLDPWTQPEITLETTDATRSPVVYVVNELHPAVLSDPDPIVTDASSWAESWRIEETRDGREARAEVTFVDDPTLDLDVLRGNEWCEVAIGHRWANSTPSGGAEFMETVLGGFLEITGRSREGRVRGGAPQLEAVVYPWTRRLAGPNQTRKWMCRAAGVSWANWPLVEAVEWLLTSCGVPEDMQSFSFSDPGLAATLRVPCARPWERRYAFGHEDSVIAALDALVVSCGCRWRVLRSGAIDVYDPQPWDGEPDMILNESWVGIEDMIQSIHVGFDVEQRANVVLHLGATASGAVAVGHVADNDSLYDTASRDFLGDDWWSVRLDWGNTDPTTTATAELLRRSQYRSVVEWSWLGHPQLAPGMHVLVDVDGVGLPSGSIVEVLAKSSVIDGTIPDYTETVRAGVVSVP